MTFEPLFLQLLHHRSFLSCVHRCLSIDNAWLEHRNLDNAFYALGTYQLWDIFPVISHLTFSLLSNTNLHMLSLKVV